MFQKFVFLIPSCLLLTAAAVSAEGFSLNFAANEVPGSINNSVGANTAGAIPISGEYWNNLSGPNGSNVVVANDNDGNALSGVTVDWTSANTWRSGSGGATATSENGALTKGYLDDGGGGWTVELNSPYLLNDIYLIHGTDQGNPATMSAISVNGTYYKGDGAGGTTLASGTGDSWTATNWSDADILTESDNYLSVLAQPGVSLRVDTASPGRGALSGVQVENAYLGTLSYWDIDGATPGAGGATPGGVWSGLNWSASAAGDSAGGVWTAGNAAVFSAGSDATGAYTVTLAATENADAVWVQDGDVTLSGGTLALGTTGLLRADGSLTVDSALTATNLSTTGTVTLNNAANSVGGLVTINGTTTLGANNSWNKLSGAGVLEIGANTLSVGDATDSSFNGSFSGTGSVSKTGTGTLTLGNLNTGFGGSATINAGTLALTGAGNLNWDIDGPGNITKLSAGQLTVLSDLSATGDLNINDGLIQVGNVGTAGSLGNPSNITLTTNGLALRYRLSGTDATLDSSSVDFVNAGSTLRQHAGTATDKLTITNTTLGTDATLGTVDSLGGELVLGTGTTGQFNQLALANGNVTIEDGADITFRYANIGNGSGASGIVNQTGGNVTALSGNAGIRIGHWSGAGREYNLSGGTLDATALSANGGEGAWVNMGWDGEGDMTVGGGAGTATLKASGLRFDRNRGGVGSSASTITILNNGVVETTLGTQGAGTNDGVVLSGGLLRGMATANWSAQMEAAAATSSVIDLGGGVTANQTGLLFGSGDITKTGTGTLVLNNGANTHSGALLISDGTVNFNGSTSSAVTLNSGATIQAGTDTTAGPGTVGSLSLENGSASTFRLGTTSDQLNITTNDGFTVVTGATHTATIVPAGQLNVNDEFVLFDYAGTIQGDGVAGISASLPNPHYAFSVNDDVVNTQVKLKIDSIDAVIWTGAGGSIWDEQNTTSWKTESGGSPSDFYEFDIVKFDDTGADGTVTLSGTINAATTEVDTSSNNYTFAGAGLGGAGGLTKKGSSTLVLTNSNTYTGTTDVQAGTLQVGNGGTTGTLGGSGNVNVATGAQLVFNRSDAQTHSRSTVGGGTLVKDGANNLTVTGGSNAVDFVVNDGTLLARGGGWAVGFAANRTITVNAGATLDTAVHSLGGLGAGGILPGEIHLNGGTWQLNNEQYAPVLTMTGGLTTGPGEIRTTGGGIYTINASAGGSQMAARVNMVGNKTIQVADGAAAADLLVSGPIVGGAALTKTGAGRIVLSGANTATGSFFVSEGRMALTGDNSGRSGGYEVNGGILEANSVADAALGTGFIALKNGTLEYNGSGAESTARALWIDAGGQTGTFDVTNAAANLTMAPAAGTVNQEIIKNGAGTLTMQGAISGGGAVTNNAGTTVLDATNTYTGNTTINGGTVSLAAGASIDNSANIIVGASTTFDVSAVPGFTLGATQLLSGTGTVIGDLGVDGTVAPGFSPGTLNVIGNVTLGATSLLDIEIAGNLISQYDRLNITGDLTADGTIALNLTGYSPIEGDSFDIVDWTGTVIGSPTFDLSNAALDPGLAWNTSNFLSDGTVHVELIPEPSTILLAALAAFGLMSRRRRS